MERSLMVRANMMGLPADYCSSDAAADKEECAAVSYTHLTLPTKA